MPDINAWQDGYEDSWLFRCHTCRRRQYGFVYGELKHWDQEGAYVAMLVHRQTHRERDGDRWSNMTIGFNGTVFPDVRLP